MSVCFALFIAPSGRSIWCLPRAFAFSRKISEHLPRDLTGAQRSDGTNVGYSTPTCQTNPPEAVRITRGSANVTSSEPFSLCFSYSIFIFTLRDEQNLLIFLPAICLFFTSVQRDRERVCVCERASERARERERWIMIIKTNKQTIKKPKVDSLFLSQEMFLRCQFLL